MNGPPSNRHNDEFDSKGYVLRGKIMLTAIVVLFLLVILIVCLHLYARWYLFHARRRHLRRNRYQRRTQLVFYVDPANPAASAVAPRGLDAALLKSLPLFVYSPKTQEPVDCAVCLSEFEENETGRILPKCNHSFHIDCIDIWFQSHSTCPICRAPVESAPEDEAQSKAVIAVCEPVKAESSSSSEMWAECHHGGEEENRAEQTLSSSSSSIGFRRKPSSLLGITVEVPRRNESFGRGEDELGCDSPSFRSPMSRMLSFKRILSRDRKVSLSPTAGDAVGCSSMTEVETERGRGQTERNDVAFV